MKEQNNAGRASLRKASLGGMVLLLLALTYAEARSHAAKDPEPTPFEGTWESDKNEVSRWTFVGNAYEEYRELEGTSGEHYYKGTFNYKENTPRRGMILFDQTHAARTSGAWQPAEEGSSMTGYEFVDAATLKISSRIYRKK
jgi:hypothetical protein